MFEDQKLNLELWIEVSKTKLEFREFGFGDWKTKLETLPLGFGDQKTKLETLR